MLQTSLEAIQRESFKWMSAKYSQQTKHLSDADVSITRHPVSKSPNKFRYNITFRNGTQKRFGEYIDFAVAENFIMLKPSTKDEGGFKFQGITSKLNPVIQISENTVTECLKDFIGDYSIKYDPKFKLYYIDKESANDN